MTGFSNKVEANHPKHGKKSGEKQFSPNCRKCVLGENYGH
jgi:hypothetical protein